MAGITARPYGLFAAPTCWLESSGVFCYSTNWIPANLRVYICPSVNVCACLCVFYTRRWSTHLLSIQLTVIFLQHLSAAAIQPDNKRAQQHKTTAPGPLAQWTPTCWQAQIISLSLWNLHVQQWQFAGWCCLCHTTALGGRTRENSATLKSVGSVPSNSRFMVLPFITQTRLPACKHTEMSSPTPLLLLIGALVYVPSSFSWTDVWGTSLKHPFARSEH